MFTDPNDVAREIEELHQFFADWYHGQAESIDRVERALADDFTMVSPSGALVARAEVIAGIVENRGKTTIGIEVRQIQVRLIDDDEALATYEEWHHHADYSTSRQSSALFSRDSAAPHGWSWRHVHETWITPPPARGVRR